MMIKKRIGVPDNNTHCRVDTCETVTKKIVNNAMDLLNQRRAEVQRKAGGQRPDERVIEETPAEASEKTVLIAQSTPLQAEGMQLLTLQPTKPHWRYF